jgi:hypothetical protein
VEGGKHASSNKTPILRAVQRKGNVVTRVLFSVTKVDHRALQCVVGTIHTNAIEGFW